MVTWDRIDSLDKVNLRSKVVEFNQALDSDWMINENRQIKAVTQVDGQYQEFNIDSLFSGLGSSWRTIFEKGGTEDLALLKNYIKTYYKYLGVEPRIYLDVLEVDKSVPIVLRNRVLARPDGTVEEVFNDILPKFPDARALVVGHDGSEKRAEIQLLFGEDQLLKESPEKNDVVNHGIFLQIDSGVDISYGINRLICTNGLTARTNVWNRDLSRGMRDESINEIQKLVHWFSQLPNRRVGHVRELSILFDQFSPTVIKRYWKEWSEKVELQKLTFFDVVNDVTSHANNTLSYTRRASLGIRNNFKRIEERCECPTCRAKIS